MRVPMIARLPGRIPAGSSCRALTSTMDFLPTFCALAEAPLPSSPLDGHDIRSLLTAKSAKSPYEAFYYYRRRQLQAVRSGDWKYHLPLDAIHPNWTSAKPTRPGRKGKLVNLANDLKERHDLSAAHPEVVAHMQAFANSAIADLGNDAQDGSGQRAAADLANSAALTLEGKK